MADFYVDEIAKEAGGRLVKGARSKTRGVRTDSRNISCGSLFVAIKGENFDGNRFASEAFDHGAAAALVSDPSLEQKLPGKTLIVVDDTVSALQKLAAYHRLRFKNLLMIGVTGSNGKTTVKDMIASALSRKYRTLKTEGNLNNYVGLPLTLLRIKPSHEAAVVEMGMNMPGEIGMLTDLAAPGIGVITNVGPAHIGNFNSIAGVRRAKGELIEHMDRSGAVVLNEDDSNSRPLIEKARTRLRKVVTFGRSPWADVSLVDSWSNGKVGRWASVHFKGGENNMHVPLLGARHVENALCAFTAASLAGIKPKEIVKGIEKVRPAPMRMEPVSLQNGALLINDAYNANPVSTQAALEALAERADLGKLFFVFGDMLELGKKSETAHRKIGRLAASIGVNRMYALGAMASLAASEAEKRGVRVHTGGSARSVANALAKSLKPGDTALVKGSRGIGLEKVVERLIEIVGGR